MTSLVVCKQRYLIKKIPFPENKGKDHCTAGLLFILFGFSCFAYVELETVLLVWSVKQEISRTVILSPRVSVLCLGTSKFYSLGR